MLRRHLGNIPSYFAAIDFGEAVKFLRMPQRDVDLEIAVWQDHFTQLRIIFGKPIGKATYALNAFCPKTSESPQNPAFCGAFIISEFQFSVL